jgi:hypothetical protein
MSQKITMFQRMYLPSTSGTDRHTYSVGTDTLNYSVPLSRRKDPKSKGLGKHSHVTLGQELLE